MDIAQTGTVTTTVMVVALVAIAGWVALGVYRTRRSTAGEQHYQALAEGARDAEVRTADAVEAMAAELKGLRSEASAARDELVEVKQRLGELERLLSQIG